MTNQAKGQILPFHFNCHVRLGFRIYTIIFPPSSPATLASDSVGWVPSFPPIIGTRVYETTERGRNLKPGTMAWRDS